MVRASLATANAAAGRISRRIKDEFENGKEYYSSHGKLIALPAQAGLQPAAKFLSWHNRKVYLG